jgi:hypothetical protein
MARLLTPEADRIDGGRRAILRAARRRVNAAALDIFGRRGANGG